MSAMQKIDISSSTIFRVIIILLGFWFVYYIFDIVLLLFSAFIVAAVVEPAAKYFDRYRVPRALTVITIYLIFLLSLASIISLMVSPLTEQVRQLATVVPNVIVSLNNFVPFWHDLNQADLINTIQTSLLRLSGNITNIGFNIFAGTRSVVSGLVTFLLAFVIALYLVVERDALKKFARLVTPAEHYPYVSLAIERAQKSVGQWVMGQVLLGVIIGTMTGVGLWLIGVPYALLFGLLSGVLELIPAIGTFIAAIPGVLVAFSHGWLIGLIALGWYTIVGQLENHVLSPQIMRRIVGLPPLVTIIAVILGARLLGIIGVVFAIPIATIFGIIISDLFHYEEKARFRTTPDK